MRKRIICKPFKWNEGKGVKAQQEFHVWKNAVLARDHFMCQYPGCKHPRRNIMATRINHKYVCPMEQYVVSNGITLCHVHINYKGVKRYRDYFLKLARSHSNLLLTIRTAAIAVEDNDQENTT